MTTYSSFWKATPFIFLLAAAGVPANGVGGTQSVPQPQRAPGVTSLSFIGEATFDHRLHFENLQIECKACHHETNAAALKMPHTRYFDDFWIDCSICHKSGRTALAKPQSCSMCHHGSPATIADETLSAKVVIHKKCWECHESGRGQKASNGCTTCHVKTPRDAVPQAPSVSGKKG